MTHSERIGWRDYLNRKKGYRYHVTLVRRDTLNGKPVDNLIRATQSNDINELFAIADEKAPAYIIDNWARPTPEVAYVALPKESHLEKTFIS